MLLLLPSWGKHYSSLAVLIQETNLKQHICNKYNSHELAFGMIAAAFVCVTYIGKKEPNGSYSEEKIGPLFSKSISCAHNGDILCVFYIRGLWLLRIPRCVTQKRN